MNSSTEKGLTAEQEALLKVDPIVKLIMNKCKKVDQIQELRIVV